MPTTGRVRNGLVYYQNIPQFFISSRSYQRAAIFEFDTRRGVRRAEAMTRAFKTLVQAVFLCCAAASIASAQQEIPILGNDVTIPLAPGSRSFKVVLTTNVGLFTFANASAGDVVNILFTQDSVGGRTVTFAQNIQNIPTINLAANATTAAEFQFDVNSDTWFGVIGSSNNATSVVPLSPGGSISTVTGMAGTESITCPVLNCGLISNSPVVVIGTNQPACNSTYTGGAANVFAVVTDGTYTITIQNPACNGLTGAGGQVGVPQYAYVTSFTNESASPGNSTEVLENTDGQFELATYGSGTIQSMLGLDVDTTASLWSANGGGIEADKNGMTCFVFVTPMDGCALSNARVRYENHGVQTYYAGEQLDTGAGAGNGTSVSLANWNPPIAQGSYSDHTIYTTTADTSLPGGQGWYTLIWQALEFCNGANGCGGAGATVQFRVNFYDPDCAGCTGGQITAQSTPYNLSTDGYVATYAMPIYVGNSSRIDVNTITTPGSGGQPKYFLRVELIQN